jgi:hypothetical protein
MVRAGAHGETIVNQLCGKYYEDARRGNIYFARSAVAGVVPPIYTSVTPLFPLWNVSQAFNLVPLRLQLTPLAGPLIHGQYGFAIITAGFTLGVPISAFTDTDIICAKTLLAGRHPAVRFGSTATVAAPTQFLPIPICNQGVYAITTSTAPGLSSNDLDFDGQFVVPPGMCICLSGNVAMSVAHLITLSFSIQPVQPGI